MKIIEMKVSELKPYENNPRKNDNAVKYVAKSIEKFGFKVPIIVDKNNVIVCGHTRWKAAKRLKYKTVPCIMADDLTDEQIKAFRLADNKVSEFAEWDFSMLDLELGDLKDAFNLADFGFDLGNDNGNSQNLSAGEEIDADDFGDDKFECTCPKCGFRFNMEKKNA